MILACYDGSDDAKAAIDRAAQLMSGTAMTVVTVWERALDAMARRGAMAGASMGAGWVASELDTQKLDAEVHQAALATATAGAQYASAAGLDATPRAELRRDGVAYTILSAAEDCNADVVVIGTRGLGGVKSFLLGSVSHSVVQHADRAVLVVPSPALAERRRDHVESAAAVV